MTWTLRTDVAAAERCYEGKDPHGRVFAYLQEFQDGSAGYWFKPQQQATPAKSVDEAKRLAAERAAFPFEVVVVANGQRHLSERYEADTPGLGPLEEAKAFASALLRNIRGHDGYANLGDAALQVNVPHKIARVQIIASDGTVLQDQPV